ncbi:MAG: signal peptidase I [Bacteroidales bacterium]
MTKNKKIKNFVIPYAITLNLIIIIFVTCLKLIRVNGYSMTPTLFDGDIVLGIKPWLIHSNSDLRNRILTFSNSESKSKSVIKRCLGIPGDSIEYLSGFLKNHNDSTLLKYQRSKVQVMITSMEQQIYLEQLFIHNHIKSLPPQNTILNAYLTYPQYQNLLKNYTITNPFSETDYFINRINELLGGSKKLIVIPYKGYKLKENPYCKFHKRINNDCTQILYGSHSTIQKNEYLEYNNDCFFFIGDNYNSSKDSRSFGFVPENMITSLVIFRIFSSKENKTQSRNLLTYRPY